MGEKRTTVVLEAKARGFEKAERDVKKTFAHLDTKEVQKGFKQLTYLVGEMGRQVKGMTAGMKEANQALRMRDGLAGTKEMNRELERMKKQIDQLTEAKRKGAEADNKSASRSQINRRGFAMGVMQGSGVGEYFPEQGLRANIAGRAVGRGGRRMAGIAGSVASSPFTGMQGASQGLAGVPVVGGFLAGQLQNLLSAGGEALALRTQMQGMQQVGGGSTSKEDLAAAYSVGAAAAPQIGPKEIKLRASAQAQRQMQASLVAGSVGTTGGGPSANTLRAKDQASAAQIRSDFPGQGEELTFGKFSRSMSKGRGRAALANAEAAGEAVRREEERAAIEKSALTLSTSSARTENRRRREQGGRVAREGARRRPFQGLIDAGLNFGAMAAPQALQFGQQMAQTAGGSFNQFSREDFNLAVASNTMGITGDVSGAFARGGRLGGSSNGGFLEAYQGTKGLGLEGSDLTRHMRQMATQIMQWDSTGIPFNVESTNQMAASIGATVGAVTGARLAMGVRQAAIGISQGGPQNAVDYQLLQDLTGFTGGGIEEWARATAQLERGEFKAGGFRKFVQRSNQSDSPEVNAMHLQTRLASRVGSVSREQAQALLANDPEATAEMMARMKANSSADPRNDVVVDRASRRSAANKNKRMALGGLMVGSMLDAEESSTETLKGFSSFHKEIGEVTKMIRKSSKDASGFIERIHTLLEKAEASLGLLPGGQ